MVMQVINSRRLSKLQWLALAVILLLILAGTIFALEKTHVINLYTKPVSQNEQPEPVNTIDYSPPTENDNQISNTIKQGDENSSTSNSGNLNVSFTYLTQDQSSKSLIVKSLVDGAITGSCTLELIKNDSVVYTKTGDMMQFNYVTCPDFIVPASEIPTLGEITVKITAEFDGNSATTSQNIMLEK